MSPANRAYLDFLLRAAVSECGDRAGHFTLGSFRAVVLAEFAMPEAGLPLWRARQMLHAHSWIRHYGGWEYSIPQESRA